jgi:Bacterial Ig-like domain (group 3)
MEGNPVTFTATISAPGGSMPTGTMYFSDGRTPIGKVHTTAGIGSFSTNALKAGEHFITANFSGDGSANYLGGASHGVIQMVNDPSDVGTQTALTVAERHQQQRADQVGFTVRAKVTSSGSTTAVTTGEVTFVFMYGFRTAQKLDWEGEATLSSVLPVSSWRGYQIEAIYSGGNGLQSSMSTLTLQ